MKERKTRTDFYHNSSLVFFALTLFGVAMFAIKLLVKKTVHPNVGLIYTVAIAISAIISVILKSVSVSNQFLFKNNQGGKNGKN